MKFQLITSLVAVLSTVFLLQTSILAHSGHAHHHHRQPSSTTSRNADHNKAKAKMDENKWWNAGVEIAAHTKHFHHGIREIKPGGVYEFSPHLTLWDHVTIGGSTVLGTHRYYTEWNAYINFSYEYKKWLGEIGYGFRRKQTNYEPPTQSAHHHDDDHDDHHHDEEQTSHSHKYHDEHSFNFGLSYLGLPYIVPSLHGHWIFRENTLGLEPSINAYIPLIKNNTGTLLTLNPAVEFGIRAYKSEDDHTHDHFHYPDDHFHYPHDHLHYTNFRLQFDYTPTSYIKISPYIAHLIPLESGPHANHTYAGIKVSFEF